MEPRAYYRVSPSVLKDTRTQLDQADEKGRKALDWREQAAAPSALGGAPRPQQPWLGPAAQETASAETASGSAAGVALAALGVALRGTDGGGLGRSAEEPTIAAGLSSVVSDLRAAPGDDRREQLVVERRHLPPPRPDRRGVVGG